MRSLRYNLTKHDALEKIPPPEHERMSPAEGTIFQKGKYTSSNHQFSGANYYSSLPTHDWCQILFWKNETHLLNLHFGVPSPFIILAGVLLHRKKETTLDIQALTFQKCMLQGWLPSKL